MRKQCAWWECKKWFKKKHNCQKYCCVACQDKAIAEKKRRLRAERSVPEDSVAIFWIAKISNFEEPDEFRKIKIISHKQDFALRQAKDFCGMEEYVMYLYDKENKLVWEITPEEKESLKNIFVQNS